MTINGIKENVLIKLLIRGDKSAFELIFKFYYPGLVVFASQFVLNETDAEEIVQDFFVCIWQNKEKIRESDTLKSYFFTSVKNRSLNLLKKNKLKDNLIKTLLEISNSDVTYNHDIFLESELQVKIKKSYESIPKKSKQVFLLSRQEGLSNSATVKPLKTHR